MKILSALFFAAATLLPVHYAHAQALLRTHQNLCVDLKDGGSNNGAALQLWACAENNSNQQWTLQNGQVRAKNGKCLDLKDGVAANGRAVQVWDCSPGSQNQQWQLLGTNLKHMGSNMCLDVTDGRFQNGTLLQVWSCVSGAENQSFAQSGSLAAPSGGPNPYGYLQAQGDRIVDRQGRQVLLQGTNIGGWLVTEGWMNGYRDDSDKDPFRFAWETLDRRFGEQASSELIRVWQDRFFTTSDLDFLQTLGVNAIRVPFGFRNLQRADGTWIKNDKGNIDFARLDWVVAEAGRRGIYTILDFHIWQGQKEQYDAISQNSDTGRAQQQKAAAIWTQVAKRYRGNPFVAGFDAINEPTGSYANLMQDALYRAIRAVDQDRIIFMESTDVDPKLMGWKQVSYSIHQYNMMGQDYGQNRKAFGDDLKGAIATFRRHNIPTYIGEFMVQEEGDMLSWLLGQYKSQGLHWTNWTYKTVDMGAWGLCNLPGAVRVDVLNDSYDTIRSRWQSMGQCTPRPAVVDAFRRALR